MQNTWTQVDEYFDDALLTDDDALEAALKASTEAGLPEIAVAPNQGKLLRLFAQMQGAKSILEIGTLGGYSTIWLASALPDDGKLITLEYDPHHAKVAGENIKAAGYSDQVDIRVGAAVDTLPVIAEEGHIFDFIFLDANKDDYPAYLEWALKLSRVGTTIFIDNVVRNGAVIDANSEDNRIQGVREMVSMMKTNPRIDASFLQSVGGKGYDGFILGRVVS